MINRYTEKFNKIVKAINSDAMKKYVHIDNHRSFTRKIPLEDIVLCMLFQKD